MVRRLAIAAIALTAIACKGDKAKAPEGGGGSAAAVPAEGSAEPAPRKGPMLDTRTIAVPLVLGASWPSNGRALAVTAGGLVLFPAGRPSVDEGGQLALDDATPVATAELADALPPAATVVVVGDAKADAGAIVPVFAGLGLRCAGLGVADGGALGALVPSPCPPPAPTDPERVQLAVWVGRDRVLVGLSRVHEISELADTGPLEAILVEHKTSAFFADRTDLALAVDDGVTVGELAAALGAAHRAGFTATRWIPAAALPMSFGDGTGRTPAPGSGAAPVPTVRATFGAITGDFSGGLLEPEIARIVKARTGIVRACYQRQLASEPALAGDLAVSVEIAADGTVASASVTGSLAKHAVGTCVQNQFRRMRFPAKGGAKALVPITFAPS
jgi:hypothetical protein